LLAYAKVHAINHAEFSKQVARQKQEKHDAALARALQRKLDGHPVSPVEKTPRPRQRGKLYDLQVRLNRKKSGDFCLLLALRSAGIELLPLFRSLLRVYQAG
jgi:hypothetical protein